ncbi:hypothetical protein [Pseudoalteromonas sp. SCSIO 43101]|uniref:hypothetical protein n=1 Tax=Pseudoalteromonas sp. SCSIO 43101 TaxID=2822847 RepID=UPI00202AD7C1|nr:hypothetical protein [Pseudoalteromonas sp. SCSIO 43101]URQ89962.1 hypothetical protein J8Z25_14555 [Pseudoalteromonas sp. SCSIO 43101]
MFKKTLVALALAGVSTTSLAGTVSLNNNSTPFAAVTAPDISVEGWSVATDKKIAAGNGFAANTMVTVKADTAYVANDVVIVTVEGGSFDTTVTPSVSTAATVTGAADGTAKATFLDFSDATTLRIRLGDAVVKDGAIRIAGLKITPTSIADKALVKLNSSVLSSNSTIGTYDKGTAVTVAEFSQEYVPTVNVKLNGEVSTGKGRQEFTGTDNLKDQLKVTIAKTAGLTASIAATEVNYTLSASSLAFAADYDVKDNGGNADSKLSSTELAKAFVPTTADDTLTLSINEGYTELAVKNKPTGAIDPLDLAFTVIGNAKSGSELTAPQSFALTGKVKHANGEFTVKGLDATSVGAWTLDGSTGDVKFLPFGPQYAQSVTVTNSGNVVGDITAEIFFNGQKYTKVLTAKAAANSVTNISAEIAALAAENSVVGDARVRITINAPSSNVNAVYYHKADGDRVKTL